MQELVFAQQKQLVIEDYLNTALRPKPLSQLTFQGKSNNYTYIDAATKSLVVRNVSSGSTATLLTLEEFNAVLVPNFASEIKKNIPSVTWSDNEDEFTFQEKNSLLKFNVTKKVISKIISWNENAENLDFASNNSVAFTEKGNVFVTEINTEKVKKISFEDGVQIVCGESVHRQEFGITKGTFWSPDGSKLAYYRMDQSMVTNYPISDYKSVPAVNNYLKYPMAGAKSHHVTIGVYNIKNEKTIFLQTGEPKEQYLTNISWSADAKKVFVAVLNRDQNKMQLNRYDAETGNFEATLFEETHPKYVEPLHSIVFCPKDNSKFYWQSQRSGYNHLYEYSADGKFLRALTEGNWEVDEVLGFDESGQNLFLTASKETPLESHAYKLNIKSKELTLITPESGFHSVQISNDGKYILDNFSNKTTPLVTNLKDVTKNKIITNLLQSDNPLKDYKTGEISIFSIPSADQTTDLYVRMIKPVDFDARKKYPVMVYVYGGPHVQLVQNKWLGNADMFLMYMASQGYVIFTLDNRGSDRRGQQFENQTFRNLGSLEMEDQMAGIQYLKKQNFIDTTRMGCFGWSFGGFMTTSMMLKNPTVFKAAVAGGPVIDWKFYEIMYTERYMDNPETNADGFKNTSLLNYVTNLKGKLLIIHGLLDDTVVPQHTAAFINECIAKGVLVDYFPYPNHPHNVRGKDRVHLYKKIEDYFKRNL